MQALTLRRTGDSHSPIRSYIDSLVVHHIRQLRIRLNLDQPCEIRLVLRWVAYRVLGGSELGSRVFVMLAHTGDENLPPDGQPRGDKVNRGSDRWHNGRFRTELPAERSRTPATRQKGSNSPRNLRSPNSTLGEVLWKRRHCDGPAATPVAHGQVASRDGSDSGTFVAMDSGQSCLLRSDTP